MHVLKQNTFSKPGVSYSSNTKIPATEFCCDYQIHSPTQWNDKKTVSKQRQDQRDPNPIYFLILTGRGRAVARIT